VEVGGGVGEYRDADKDNGGDLGVFDAGVGAFGVVSRPVVEYDVSGDLQRRD